MLPRSHCPINSLIVALEPAKNLITMPSVGIAFTSAPVITVKRYRETAKNNPNGYKV
jgi:hypothetical protein